MEYKQEIEKMGLGTLYKSVLDDIECTIDKAPYDVKKRLAEQIWFAAKGIGLIRTYRGITVKSNCVMLNTCCNMALIKGGNTKPVVKMVMTNPLAESPDEAYYGIIS